MSAAEVYRKTRKVPDLFWNAYVCRPIAAALVSAIQGTRITPNQITLSAVFVALGSVALLLFVPGQLGLILGAIVFELLPSYPWNPERLNAQGPSTVVPGGSVVKRRSGGVCA